MITPFHRSYSVFKARVLAVMKYNWQPFWRVEPGRRGSKVGAHPGKGNRWWERCQRFVLCTTSTSTYYYYRLLSYGQPIDHPQERSEVEGRTTYKRLVIRRWELRDTSPLVSNLNITQAAKMSMGPYSLARVLQRGMVDPWCTSTTPLWERLGKAAKVHCPIRNLGKSWLTKQRPRGGRWTPSRPTCPRLGFKHRSSLVLAPEDALDESSKHLSSRFCFWCNSSKSWRQLKWQNSL